MAIAGLTARQERFYGERVTVWRPSAPAGGVNGAPAPTTWDAASADVRCHIGARPSQFELQSFIQSEGDNIFTLDVSSFALNADVRAGDVLQVTSGPAAKLGGWWAVRGDMQPLTWRANKQKFVTSRLSQPPAGIL